MGLAAGTRLGPYEILAPLGAGGMGEVYRARDTKLNREVAIKVLPAAVAGDAERMARFQREAQVLASLNHPNIAAVYGLEGAALVMEYVPGENLRGPLPVDEAMAIARQIGDALEAAHEKGIVHRDLKPANVKVTPEGKVKVLDFGLAKAMDEAPADLSHSPTMSLAATRAGVILGTAAYMSPEQARGKPVDSRTDIWAFGCVLYEMLTGKQCFPGETASDCLAAILAKEPDWAALPPGSQVNLLRKCLEKDPKLRLRHIGDLLHIEETAAVPSLPHSALRAPQWPWVVIVPLALALAVTLWAPWRSTTPAPHPLMRFSVDLGQDLWVPTTGAALAMSPDGSRVVFAGRSADKRFQLYIRPLDQDKATPLAGTDNATHPFFSPDGQWIGFFDDNKLKKIPVSGGAAITISTAPSNGSGAWGDDGQIVATLGGQSLSQIPALGGTPRVIVEMGQAVRWPQVLPGSQAVLFTANATSNFDDASIEALVLTTGKTKTLLRGGYYGRYIPNAPGPTGMGYLVYIHQDTLFAAPMDLGRLELTGPAVQIIEEVVTNRVTGAAQFDFSPTGLFVYRPGKASDRQVSVAWLDSSGKTMPLRSTPGVYNHPHFSPDGKRLSLAVFANGNWDVWVYDWERDLMSRLTSAPGIDDGPGWTPDGKHIVFRSDRSGGNLNLYWMRADGAGDAVRLTESKNNQVAYSFTPDGKRLAFFEVGSGTSFDIWTVGLDLSDPEHPKVGKPELFLGTPATEVEPVFSPDGRWLAYSSNESGAMEIYVRPFPGPGGKWQISSAGGNSPVWSRNGGELFYLDPDRKIRVSSYTVNGGAFVPGKPRAWSEKQIVNTGQNSYCLAPDGKRFAVLQAAESAAEQTPVTRLTFLVNFSDELRRRAAAK